MIDISAFEGRQEIDEGFILRANEEVTSYIKDFIKNQNDKTVLELIYVNNRMYALKIGNSGSEEGFSGYLYYCTLCDLPTVSEAQKTLDMKTFYKSCDVSQVIYVHPNKVDLSKVDLDYFIKHKMADFDPIRDDPEFVDLLHNRSSYKKQNRTFKIKADTNSNTIKIPSFVEEEEVQPKYDYMMRDGLTPATKNVANVRYRKDQDEDPEEICKIESILKDIIDYGFADHVSEELLYFDDDGNLIRTENVPEYDKAMSIDETSYNDDYRY